MSFGAEIDLSTLDGTDGFRIDGANTGDAAGGDIFYIGDFNGDDIDDIVIATPGYNGAAGFEGGLYVVFGTTSGFPAVFNLATINGTNGFRIVGANYEDGIANVVAGGGDINGDGFDDFAFEFDTADYNGRNNSGSVFVVYGTDAAMPSSIEADAIPGTYGFRIDGAAAGDRAGGGISLVGDINDDGKEDIIVGSTSANGLEGKVSVVFGSDAFGSTFDLSTINGTNGFHLERSGGFFFETLGYSVTAGDFNGDGFDDVVVGSPYGGTAYGSYDGLTFVVYGKSGAWATTTDLDALTASQGFGIQGVNGDDRLGRSVAMGDINDDGKDDLIVSAYFYDGGGVNRAGTTYVVFGNNTMGATFDLTTLNGANGFRADGFANDGRAGHAVAALGDINGDGFNDFIIGSPLGGRTNPADVFTDRGEAYVVFGGDTFSSVLSLDALDGSNGFTMTGVNLYDALGGAVASAGDLNGDGADDLLVAAQGFDPTGKPSAGAVYLVYGEPAVVDLPTLGITGVFSSEGNSGTKVFSFIVQLDSPAPAGGVTFDIATADGTATAGSDYVAKSLTSQTIPAGASEYLFEVLVNGDTVFESNESFFVNVTNVVGATVGDGQGDATIANDDVLVPSLSIDDVTLSEGDSGTKNYTFTVSLSSPAPAGGVTFDITTADSSARAGTDYVAKTLTSQTIPAGSSTYSFTVEVNGDTVFEADERLLVNISNVTGATVADSQGHGTILNDDTLPTISVSDVTRDEGTNTTTSFTFVISLDSPAPAGGVQFDLVTSDGTARNGSDYSGGAFTNIVIPEGATQTTVTVLVNGDQAREDDETFFATLLNVTNAILGKDTGTAFIVNDDPLPALSINDVTLAEGDAGTTNFTFTVSLTAPAPPGGVTFDVGTTNGSAASGSDYASFSALGLSIAEGATSATFTVSVNGDTVFEGNETFFANIYNVTNAIVLDDEGTGTILNDDAPPFISITSPSISEGDGGTTELSFTVFLDNPAPAGGVTFDIATANGTATAGSDYVAKSLTGQTIPAGNTTYTFTVTVNGDLDFEADETLFVNLTNVSGATVFDDQGQGTIVNDDPAAVAEDDDLSTDEDTAFTANVFDDNGNGADTIESGASLEVTEVEGSAGNVGNQVTLASGALVTLNSDGSLSYDPNGAFDSLAAGASTTDSFTYTVAGGDTATVTVTLDGVNDAPTVSISTIVWDQSEYTTENGRQMSDFVQADNFTLDAATTLTKLQFFLAEPTNSTEGVFEGFSGTVGFAIYEDNGTGVPGALITTGNDYAPVLTDTGLNLGANNGDIFAVEIDLGDVVLAAGNYWFAIHEGEWRSPSDFSPVFVLYTVTDTDQSGIGRANTTTVTSPDGTYVSRSGTAAFALYGSGGAYTAVEQTPLDLRGKIAVDDVDSTTGDISVVIAVDDGVLTATAGTTGVDIAGSGSGELTLTGTLGEIKALLASGSDGTLTYTADTDTPPASTELTVTVNDNDPVDPLSDDASVTIDITAVDDPADAIDDDVATDEATAITGSVFADNGNGADNDPESDFFEVTAVNGSGGNVGTQFALASGALVTLNADGTFSYDPNGRFDGLFFDQTATDSFTYTVTGGDTATVTVTVNGIGYNVIIGTPQPDNLYGTAFGDEIFGLASDDFIDGRGGGDLMRGGLGNDTYRVDNERDQIVELAGEGIDFVNAYANFTLPDNVENMRVNGTMTYAAGNDLENKINAAPARNGVEIHGGGGRDDIGGSKYADFIYGDDGNDVIFGDNGDDYIEGGAGNDRLTGGAGNDEMHGGADDDYMQGSKGDDTMYGDDGRDILLGEDGMDTLYGGAGVDLLRGGNQDDTLYGGEGNDQLFGDAGNDHLYGGIGQDFMEGGAGADTFYFDDDPTSMVKENGNADRIRDFSQAQGDKIDLSAMDAILGGGDDAFTFIGSAAFSGTAGELRYLAFGSALSVLQMDVDGDGKADHLIVLDGGIEFTASDFVL